MTQYLPLSWISRQSLSSTEGPTFFVAYEREDDAFFVTAGDDPQAIFVAGPHFGGSLRKALGSSWKGLAFGDVTIKVDATSAMNPMRNGAPLGSVAMADDKLYLYASAKDSTGFTDVYAWNLDTGVGEFSLNEAVAFTRWQITKQDGDKAVELASFDVTPPAPAAS